MPISELRLLFADYAMDMQLPKDIPKYRDNFKNASYARWAVNELQMYIIRKSHQPPIDSVKEFINLMDEFMKLSKKDKPIYSIAKSVAVDVLDIFDAMK